MQRRAPPGCGSSPPSGRERAGAGGYLSHLPLARGRQAGTALCAYLAPPPLPGSLPPQTAASPVTTTTNKQPPARSHCAGACRPEWTTLGLGRGRMSSLRRSAQSPALGRNLEFFSSLLSSAHKRLTPNPGFFRPAQQEGSLRELRAEDGAWGAATPDWQ